VTGCEGVREKSDPALCAGRVQPLARSPVHVGLVYSKIKRTHGSQIRLQSSSSNSASSQQRPMAEQAALHSHTPWETPLQFYHQGRATTHVLVIHCGVLVCAGSGLCHRCCCSCSCCGGGGFWSCCVRGNGGRKRGKGRGVKEGYVSWPGTMRASNTDTCKHHLRLHVKMGIHVHAIVHVYYCNVIVHVYYYMYM